MVTVIGPEVSFPPPSLASCPACTCLGFARAGSLLLGLFEVRFIKLWWSLSHHFFGTHRESQGGRDTPCSDSTILHPGQGAEVRAVLNILQSFFLKLQLCYP